MDPVWLHSIVALILVAVVTRIPFMFPLNGPLARLASRVADRVRPPSEAPAPAGRPLESIAADVRRLRQRSDELVPGTSYAKVVAIQYAYDRALAEAADALGISHLLRVLPPGDDLDAERIRVDALLWSAGFRDQAVS